MPGLFELHHIERKLAQGGQIIVLDTGAVIGPEAEAMLQALHSRSVGGLKHHLRVLGDKGPKDFLASFYVGYGHKSIGDCGTVTVFVEGISMLAAKAIQDWLLYSGQEASTRYIDFANQRFANPFVGDPSRESIGDKVLEEWRRFYLRGIEEMITSLTMAFPRQDGEKESVYEKAIRARAFDIMRGFLPAGATTNLAWHMNLRQFADQLMLLRHHPLAEVREVAITTEDALLEKFPGSFGHKRYKTTENWDAEWMRLHYYLVHPKVPEFAMTFDAVDRAKLARYEKILFTRPLKTEIPKEVRECGILGFEFTLDFGSFRDLQRHRAIHQRMPLLTTAHGFGEWYLRELTSSLRTMAHDLLVKQKSTIESLGPLPVESQYFIPMGYNVPNTISGTLPSLVYLVELRATRFVHPTLRRRAIQIAEILRDRFHSHGLRVHLDPDPDRFDVRRGAHDIVMKKI